MLTALATGVVRSTYGAEPGAWQRACCGRHILMVRRKEPIDMSRLRMAALSALMVLLLAGFGASGALDVAAAGQHTKTHPTATHQARRMHHHGSGNRSHQHHNRHARHHGQNKNHR
jgi:hypothetical protein